MIADILSDDISHSYYAHIVIVVSVKSVLTSSLQLKPNLGMNIYQPSPLPPAIVQHAI
jgi:hypothetical protein